jgi:hypothetical protein
MLDNVDRGACYTRRKTPNATRTRGVVGAESFQLRNKSLELARKCKLGEFLWLSLLRRIFALFAIIVIIAFSLCGDIIERDTTSGTRNTEWHQLLRQR